MYIKCIVNVESPYPFVLYKQLIRIRVNSSLFDEFVCKLGLFWHSWAFKKAQFTHERVEYNVFLSDEPLKGSKSLKTFKISLTCRFDKL
jgi:hypothetical protein